MSLDVRDMPLVNALRGIYELSFGACSVKPTCLGRTVGGSRTS